MFDSIHPRLSGGFKRFFLVFAGSDAGKNNSVRKFIWNTPVLYENDKIYRQNSFTGW